MSEGCGTRVKCSGVKLATGEPCHAPARHSVRSRFYCMAHYAIASREPERFRAALERWVRREARKEAKIRALDAQVDWVGVPTGELSDAVHQHKSVTQVSTS